ncbi:UDP-diphospho-muramoylpentapeptide beta-N-acetylglucosaminyltransferase, partial [Xanthomonas oryzae pv. oryzae]
HQQKSPSTAALSGAASITILVKGSRGSAMDRVVTALLASAEGASHAA